MARFERGEGRSREFWEARVDGPLPHFVFTERWGRLGTEGQVTTRTFDSRGEANDVYLSRVQNKKKKGYRRVRPRDTGPQPKSNPELEEAILRDPESPDGYLVYGDWLQSQGDPRGELIALQHALLQARGEEAQRLESQVSDLLSRYRQVLLGNRLMSAVDDKVLSVRWHLGFLRSARLTLAPRGEDPDFTVTEVLDMLLEHPSARFLQELTLGLVSGHNDYGICLGLIAGKVPRTLRTLFIGDFEPPGDDRFSWQVPGTYISWSYVDDVSFLYQALPELRSLRLRGANIQLGDIHLPELRDFTVESGGLGQPAVKSIATARWPRLERLEVWFGDRRYGAGGGVDDLRPLLDATGVPELRHLGLCNAEFTDALCQALPKSKVLRQLHTLDLSRGTLTDAGAAVLAANAVAFAHLKRLDVTQNLLGPVGVKLLEGLGPDVASGQQRYDGVRPLDHRLVAVGK